jgi:hypothetical protein
MLNVRHKAFKILDTHIELVVQNYVDRIVIILTQLNKPGAIVCC